ncbi:hypothetical protein IQ06DRAFT_84112 [Phaeosphaeriaceae sp. SRC1lsM3a]|nr:hypothetical protein IQ06DRAFT_84112 [Stagonospora sp. SRC1lsM3a]
MASTRLSGFYAAVAKYSHCDDVIDQLSPQAPAGSYVPLLADRPKHPSIPTQESRWRTTDMHCTKLAERATPPRWKASWRQILSSHLYATLMIACQFIGLYPITTSQLYRYLYKRRPLMRMSRMVQAGLQYAHPYSPNYLTILEHLC